MKKSLKTEGGKACPKCKLTMQRYEHARDWKPKAGQPYHFKFWDICKPCRHIQHYEAAKVFEHETEPANRTDETRNASMQAKIASADGIGSQAAGFDGQATSI